VKKPHLDCSRQGGEGVPDVALEGDLDLEPLSELAVEVVGEGLGFFVGLAVAGFEVVPGEAAGEGELVHQGEGIHGENPAGAGERGRRER